MRFLGLKWQMKQIKVNFIQKKMGKKKIGSYLTPGFSCPHPMFPTELDYSISRKTVDKNKRFS